MAKTRGQYLRLFLSSDNTTAPSKVIGGAKQLTLHLSANVEDASTKDTDSDWIQNEVTAINYDISTNALIRSGETITSAVQAQGLADLEDIYEAGNPVKWKIANVSGFNNRTAGTAICSGSAVISQLTINAQNRAVATYDAQLQGYGDIVVGS